MPEKMKVEKAERILLWVFGGLAAALALATAGLYLFQIADVPLGLIFLMVAVLIAMPVIGIRTLLASRSKLDASVDRMDQMETSLHELSEQLGTLIGMSQLSDQAKSLLYHENELNAMRECIHALHLKQDNQSIALLLQRMETDMGLVEEAERLRNELDSLKQASLDEKIDAAINRIDEILESHDWARSRREVQRLTAIFPTHEKIISLPQRVTTAWNAHKGQLLRDYGQAVRVNDIEQSIELLRALDKYLTPQEAAALAESARGVFRGKLHNLGVQFAIAINEQQWEKAIETGRQIMSEFPNSRMAREVREKQEVLKAYASGTATPGTSPPII